MAARRRAVAKAIRDALASLKPEIIEETVWRVVWEDDNQPLLGSGKGGRWTPPGTPVLYTSLDADGACAEVNFRLSLETIRPTLLRHRVHRLRVRTERALRITHLADLSRYGIDAARYQTRDYRATQRLAAAAYECGFDSIVAPSARANCLNLAVFSDRVPPGQLTLEESEYVDWDEFLAHSR